MTFKSLSSEPGGEPHRRSGRCHEASLQRKKVDSPKCPALRRRGPDSGQLGNWHLGADGALSCWVRLKIGVTVGKCPWRLRKVFILAIYVPYGLANWLSAAAVENAPTAAQPGSPAYNPAETFITDPSSVPTSPPREPYASHHTAI